MHMVGLAYKSDHISSVILFVDSQSGHVRRVCELTDYRKSQKQKQACPPFGSCPGPMITIMKIMLMFDDLTHSVRL